MVLKTNTKRGEGKSTFGTSLIYDQDDARLELAKMIILHEYPLSIVEHVGFRNYSSALQPLFKVPSRNTIRSDILKLYEQKRQMTSMEMENCKSRISITTDMWTSDHHRKGYMAVTAHYIDNSWRLQNRIIRFCYVPAPHDKEVISECLMNCIMDWNIDRRICTLTVDNCSVNDGVIDLIIGRIGTGELLLDGTLLHMRCAAHILNLIVQDGLSIIAKRIERIRESVLYWTTTPKRVEKFEEAARQLRISNTKKLSIDVKTRWNSTFLMLNSALPYIDVFGRLKLREPKYKSVPSEEDWIVASDICDRFKVFHRITKLISGTKYPTSNLLFLHVCEIRLALHRWICDTDKLIKDMAIKMLDKFLKYWDMTRGIVGVACMLDPRYKTDLLEFYYEKIFGKDETTKQVRRIVGICTELLEEYERKQSKEDEHTPSSCTLSQKDEEGGGHMEKFAMFVSSKRLKRASFKSELEHYLDDDILPNSSDFDVLEWWKTNGLKYPSLQVIARDILAIPVTSVASESAFSMGGRLLSPHRNRLHPSTVEALACCHNWLWADKATTSSHLPDEYRMLTFLEDEDNDIHAVDG